MLAIFTKFFATRRKIPTLDIFISIIAFWVLAVAKPLLDVVGKSPEYWVANRIDGFIIILLTFGLTIILPAMVSGLLVIVSNNKYFSRIVQFLYSIIFIALTSIAFYHGFSFQFGKTIYLAYQSIAFAIIFLLFYRTYKITRQFVFVFSIIIGIIVPLHFLFFGSTKSLVFPLSKFENAVDSKVELKTPVIVIVYDELSLASLIDSNGLIDERLFPNFKKFADSSTWYKNATTNYGSSEKAVPAILTGSFTNDGKSETSFRQLPNNLFTYIKAPDGVLAIEPLTDLCPPSVCHEKKTSFGKQIKQACADFWLIYKNIIVPDEYASKIQSIPMRFNELVLLNNADSRANNSTEHGEGIGGRVNVAGLIDKWFKEGHNSSLIFVHYELPHAPYTMNPNGTKYSTSPDYRMIGWIPKTHSWEESEVFYVTQAYQRYLLQLMYADRTLGEILNTLEKNNVFDLSTIILTADHGVGFTKGGSRRSSTFAGSLYSNVQNVAIPLFWKSSGQKCQKESLQNIESIDILPSLLDELGNARLHQGIDGSSIFATVEKNEKTFNGINYSKDVWPSVQKANRELYNKIEITRNYDGTFFPQQSKYSKYIGLKVEETKTIDTVVGVNNPSVIRQLREGASESYTPNLIDGTIENNNDIETIAVTINNVIVDVVDLKQEKGKKSEFVSVFNPAFLRLNDNRLGFLSVKYDKSNNFSYSILKTKEKEFLIKNDVVVSYNGASLKRAQNRLFGSISFDNRMPGILGIGGWVADRNSMKPPIACIVWYEGKQQLFKTTVIRPDLEKLGENMINSGFSTSIRLNSLVPDYNSLRVVVIFEDETYAEFENRTGIQDGTSGGS